mgnify:CR=1 FL=1
MKTAAPFSYNIKIFSRLKRKRKKKIEKRKNVRTQEEETKQTKEGNSILQTMKERNKKELRHIGLMHINYGQIAQIGE